MVVYHDESIYNSNEWQKWMWGKEERPALLLKTKGTGLMVPDFIEEHYRYLRLSDEQFGQAKLLNSSMGQCASVVFEHGSERGGYWTGERFLTQMKTAGNVAHFKYPAYPIPWFSYLTRAAVIGNFYDKALAARNILVKDVFGTLSGQGSLSPWCCQMAQPRV